MLVSAVISHLSTRITSLLLLIVPTFKYERNSIRLTIDIPIIVWDKRELPLLRFRELWIGLVQPFGKTISIYLDTNQIRMQKSQLDVSVYLGDVTEVSPLAKELFVECRLQLKLYERIFQLVIPRSVHQRLNRDFRDSPIQELHTKAVKTLINRLAIRIVKINTKKTT